MRRRGIKRNGPETIGSACASDDDSVLLEDFDIILGKKDKAVVVTKLCKRHEGAGLQVVEDDSGLRGRAEKRGEREETFESRRHNSAASRENGRTSGSRSGMTEMDNIRAGNKSAGGTRIKNNMRVRGAVYRRER
jgi:hypothetical protein